jgi:hypothetical protein
MQCLLQSIALSPELHQCIKRLSYSLSKTITNIFKDLTCGYNPHSKYLSLKPEK